MRCSVCRRFARLLVADNRCEPCAGVLPLDFTPRPVAELPVPVAEPSMPMGLGRLCAELGQHDWDQAAQPCDCGRPHPFRICARCLTPDESQCAGGAA